MKRQRKREYTSINLKLVSMKETITFPLEIAHTCQCLLPHCVPLAFESQSFHVHFIKKDERIYLSIKVILYSL